jgi:hypothetical protein
MKPTTLLEKGEGREGGNGNIMEGMNLFKVHCTHVWNYHSEVPLIINACKYETKF